MTGLNDLERKFDLILKYVTEFTKDNYKLVASGLIIGILVYLPLMSGNLVNNFDGIWHPSHFIAGNWEISLGRGLQRYADRARFGLVTSSFNSLLVIALLAIGDSMVIKKLSIQNTFMKVVFVFLTIANPVVCESLTYSYMSVNFALPYLFSIVAFCVVCSKRFVKYHFNALLAAIFFAVSMGFYQSYIGVTLVLVAIYLIQASDNGMDSKQYFRNIIDTVIMILLGGLIYIALTGMLCSKAGVSLSSYKGADNVSLIGILCTFPQSVISCYREFVKYVFSNGMSINLEFSYSVIILVIGIEILFAVRKLIKICKTNKVQAVVSAICFIALPVASCFVCILAVGNEMRGLMTTGIIMAIIMPVIILADNKTTKILSGLVLLVISFYFVSAVERDQIALHEGKVATTTLVQSIYQQIYENNYMEQVNRIAFIGRVADNPAFRKSAVYESANEYAQFGKWSTDTRNNRVTWEGVINEFCGLNVNMCGDDTYDQIKAMSAIESMPVYPGKGSMMIIDDVLVIKVSNNY